MTPRQQKLFKAALKDGIRIQHRFRAEPTLAAHGVGYLESEGVAVMQKAREGIVRTQTRRALALHQ